MRNFVGMNFDWIKTYLPRSLFGRSLIILLFPVVLLQLTVGMVFIQRHFDQVTRQMARSVAMELEYTADVVDVSNSEAQAQIMLATLTRPFSMRLEFEKGETLVPGGRRFFYDVSGRALMQSLQNNIERPLYIDLRRDPRTVLVRIQTEEGILNAIVSRNRVNASNPHQLLVMMLMAAIILTIIAVIFLRNQVKPIKELSEASEAFGKGQNITYKPSGATEVRSAGRAFVAMRSRIERQIEQRTMMLSGVSHDLRTPLTRIRLALAMMDDDEAEPMVRDVEEMQRMLDLFLEFARGDSTEQTVKVDPYELVEEIVEAHKVHEHHITYTADNPDAGVRVSLRPMAISRVVENLISNAYKYGTEALIHVSVNKKYLLITVIDNGPGIQESERADAMKPFVRLDPSRNQNVGGVGLGLAIAADVARSHGGSLELSESDKLGGLKAVLKIPR